MESSTKSTLQTKNYSRSVLAVKMVSLIGILFLASIVIAYIIVLINNGNTELHKEIESLKSEYSTLQTKIFNMQTKINNLQKEMDSFHTYKTKIDKFESQTETFQEKIKDLSSIGVFLDKDGNQTLQIDSIETKKLSLKDDYDEYPYMELRTFRGIDHKLHPIIDMFQPDYGNLMQQSITPTGELYFYGTKVTDRTNGDGKKRTTEQQRVFICAKNFGFASC